MYLNDYLPNAAVVGNAGKYVVAGRIDIHTNRAVLIAQHAANSGGAENKSHIVLTTLQA